MSYPQMLTPTEKLASGLTQLNIPDIIVLCGSTRFMTEMADIDRELTWAGHIVLKPGCDMKTPDPLWADPAKAEAGKQRLDELHRAKIRLAGGVLVVGDYIGDSTRREIAYARELGKPVTFMHPEVDPGEPDSDPAAAEACGTRDDDHGLSCDDLREELKERKATLGALVDHWRGLALDRAATIDRLRTEAAEVRAAALDDHERQFLTFALDLAADRVLSEDGFTDEDDAALASLRRMAAAARPDNTRGA